jgi:hypothetical protein
MINLEIDFDAIRETAIDYVYFLTGKVTDVVESAIDVAEQLYEKLPDA